MYIKYKLKIHQFLNRYCKQLLALYLHDRLFLTQDVLEEGSREVDFHVQFVHNSLRHESSDHSKMPQIIRNRCRLWTWLNGNIVGTQLKKPKVGVEHLLQNQADPLISKSTIILSLKIIVLKVNKNYY